MYVCIPPDAQYTQDMTPKAVRHPRFAWHLRSLGTQDTQGLASKAN